MRLSLREKRQELDKEIFRNFASVIQLHKCQKALEYGKIAKKSQKLGLKS